MADSQNIIKDILFGISVGDALGVPAEFMTREEVRRDPVTGMRGHGTWNQSPGTWSDDSSLTFCLAEALTQPFSLDAIAGNFVRWYREGYWTAHGEVFDIGKTTQTAIQRIMRGITPEKAGEEDEVSNGNGSLMRILPLVLYIHDKDITERFDIIRQVSSITHRHIRSVLACFYYLEFARLLLDIKDKFAVYKTLQKDIPAFMKSVKSGPDETIAFGRLLFDNIWELPDSEISTTGYVVHTLDASVWCLLTTDSYSEAVLKAVNLGGDTDTIAAITGGLAALLYGYESIPSEWIMALARKEDIDDLAERVGEFYRK